MNKLMAIAAAVAAMAAQGGVNLLQNGDFSFGTQCWGDRTKPSQRVEVVDSPHGKALKVTVAESGGKNLGQIIQIRQGAKPNAKYRVSAQVEGPKDAALVQVKLMNGKKEGARIQTPASDGGWTKLDKEFETEADTTGIQVLLRFRMGDSMKGKSVSFADVRLEGVSGGAENDLAPEPPKKPEAVKDVVAAPGSDATIRPGDSKDAVAAALAKLGPGNVLTVAAGEYSNISGLELRAGGTKAKPIVIRGEVKDGKRPVLTGTWKREKPANGPVFLSLKPGTSYVTIENLELRNFKSALVANGPNHGVKVAKVDLSYCRDGYVLDGGMVDGVPDSGSSGFEMTDCKILFHTKKGVRTSNGFHHAKFVRCIADGGGKDYANIEPRDIFSVGFQLMGSYRGKGGRKVDHHIEFIDCEANNNYYDPTPKRYWNADGFCTEAATEDVSFIRCKASGNTDGGWDIKTVRPKFIECSGIGNKRNFRVWTKKGEVSLFEKCLSQDCWNVGQSGHQCGFWALGGGEVDYIGCTSKGDDVPFSIEAHGKEGEPPPETLMKIRSCKVEPKGERIYGRMDGKIIVDTDGSVAKPE